MAELVVLRVLLLELRLGHLLSRGAKLIVVLGLSRRRAGHTSTLLRPAASGAFGAHRIDISLDHLLSLLLLRSLIISHPAISFSQQRLNLVNLCLAEPAESAPHFVAQVLV